MGSVARVAAADRNEPRARKSGSGVLFFFLFFLSSSALEKRREFQPVCQLRCLSEALSSRGTQGADRNSQKDVLSEADCATLPSIAAGGKKTKKNRDNYHLLPNSRASVALQRGRGPSPDAVARGALCRGR